jgi:hypothetical protein
VTGREFGRDRVTKSAIENRKSTLHSASGGKSSTSLVAGIKGADGVIGGSLGARTGKATLLVAKGKGGGEAVPQEKQSS